MSSREQLQPGRRLAEVGEHREPAGGPDRLDGLLGSQALART